MESDEWIPCIVVCLPEFSSLSQLQTLQAHNILVTCWLESH